MVLKDSDAFYQLSLALGRVAKDFIRTFIKLNYKTISGEQLLLKPQDLSSCTRRCIVGKNSQRLEVLSCEPTHLEHQWYCNKDPGSCQPPQVTYNCEQQVRSCHRGHDSHGRGWDGCQYDNHPVKEILKDSDHGLVEEETDNGNTFLHERWLVMAPWCHDGKHVRSLLSDAKLMETILEVDVRKCWVVWYAINVE